MFNKKISKFEKSKQPPINPLEKIKIKKAEQKQTQGKFLTKREKILLGLIKSRLTKNNKKELKK